MKIGLTISKFSWKGDYRDILIKIARAGEKEGFYSLWVMDHFFQIHYIGSSDEPMFEGYTTLGFLTGVTEKIKLGTLVTGVVYRQPGVLIKQVTTLDNLSAGRAYLGIGAAWNEEEAVGLGLFFPPLKERFERLEETLKIAHQMFKGDAKAFSGKFTDMKKPMNNPKPLSKPHPPILIGGSGEKKTLRLVAEYADACNLFAYGDTAEIKHKLEVLKEHCRDVGRDYDEIEKTALTNTGGSINPDKILTHLKSLSELGITHVIFGIDNIETLEPLKIFGSKIIPEADKI